MKYYLTYLNDRGDSVKINLSSLPFFKGKPAGKILNIIEFYNQFDTPEYMLDYLFSKGLVEKNATADFRIVIKRKNKYDKEYYQVIPHSDIPLVSCTKHYFDKTTLREFVMKRFKDNEFVSKLRDEFGYLKDYSSNEEDVENMNISIATSVAKYALVEKPLIQASIDNGKLHLNHVIIA